VQSRADNSLEWVSQHGSAQFEKEGQRALFAVVSGTAGVTTKG